MNKDKNASLVTQFCTLHTETCVSICNKSKLEYVLLALTDASFENGESRVPSKSQKSFICGGMGQTITLKPPGKGAPP